MNKLKYIKLFEDIDWEFYDEEEKEEKKLPHDFYKHPYDFIGIKVRLDKSSRFYNDTKFNPTDSIGEIIEIIFKHRSKLNIRVEWEKYGTTNAYSKDDLVLI